MAHMRVFAALTFIFTAFLMPNISISATNDQIVVEEFKSAIKANDITKVQNLIKIGANVNASDSSGKTPLDYAQEAKATQIELLLKINGAKNGTAQADATPTTLFGWIEKGKKMWQELQSNIPQEVKEQASGYFRQYTQPQQPQQYRP